jgi:hypothetical protein
MIAGERPRDGATKGGSGVGRQVAVIDRFRPDIFQHDFLEVTRFGQDHVGTA